MKQYKLNPGLFQYSHPLLLTAGILLLTGIIHTLFADNQNLSNGVVFDGEPYLAINPNNSQHLVVAWMGYFPLQRIQIKVRVSFDGGQSWSSTSRIPHVSAGFTSADPSLAFDNGGNVYLAYIDFNTQMDSGAVYVRRSIDGGLSWGVPAEVIGMHSDPGKKPIDRPWLVADQSNGTYQGNLYLTTMNARGASGPFHPYFMKSIDQGSSWSPWRYADTTGWLAGFLIPQPMPSPAVAANGTFHCAYPSWVIPQNPNPQYILATSTNAGNHFSYHTIFDTPDVFSDSLAKKGYLLIADPVDANHLAFFYLSPLYGDADVVLRESFDNGNSWSSPLRINDDPIGNNRMQDMLWADFDTDGDLVVCWRDRRNAPDSSYATASEIWCACRRRDSTTFSPNFSISDSLVPYDSVLAASGNDFMSVKLMNDTLYAVWGDVRTGKLNVWFEKRALPDSQVVAIGRPTPELVPVSLKLRQNYPNPFNPVTAISYQLPAVSQVQLEIYNTIGQRVRTLVNRRQAAGRYTVQWDGRNDASQPVASGVYVYRLTVGQSSSLSLPRVQTRKMVLLR